MQAISRHAFPSLRVGFLTLLGELSLLGNPCVFAQQ